MYKWAILGPKFLKGILLIFTPIIDSNTVWVNLIELTCGKRLLMFPGFSPRLQHCLHHPKYCFLPI